MGRGLGLGLWSLKTPEDIAFEKINFKEEKIALDFLYILSAEVVASINNFFLSKMSS